MELEKLKEKIRKLTIEDRWLEYADVKTQTRIWQYFFDKKFKSKVSNSVLDFGSGATWAEYTFKKSHLVGDIKSLDINNNEVKKVFGAYAKALGNKVTYYDGNNIPFEDNYFTDIIFKASIMKPESNKLTDTVRELVRVSKNGSVWYIAPYSMHYRFIDTLKKHPELSLEISKKALIFEPWTWDRWEWNNRSKKMITEFKLGFLAVKIYSTIKVKLKKWV